MRALRFSPWTWLGDSQPGYASSRIRPRGTAPGHSGHHEAANVYDLVVNAAADGRKGGENSVPLRKGKVTKHPPAPLHDELEGSPGAPLRLSTCMCRNRINLVPGRSVFAGNLSIHFSSCAASTEPPYPPTAILYECG